MYAYESPQFNSGMLLHYLTTQLAQIGKASGLALLLISRINWKQDANDFGPRGTVNHLTVRKMADALGCSQSTVQEHLAILRSVGIIESEPVADQNGATRYCRMWFAGFVSWLQHREPKEPEPAETETGSEPPSETSERGGSEKLDPYHNTKNQNFIDLEQVKSVWFSPLETVIREAEPKLANGLRADCQMVFEQFRSFNLRKGTSRISFAALRGFARNFREFRPKATEPSQEPTPRISVPSIPSAPVPAQPVSPLDAQMKSALRARDPELFDAWFAKVSFSRDGDELRVKAPTAFIRSYLSDHYEQMIRNAAKAGPETYVIFS